jgi:2-methylcitrate dehydratase PrpD
VLSEFVSSLNYESLPLPVRQMAAICIMDYLGAAIVGSQSREAILARNFVRQMGGNPQAKVIGAEMVISMPLAALANGVAAHVYELDDAHRYATGLHPGATIIPAVLAAGQFYRKGRKEIITALVAGYEVAARVGRAINPSHRYRGFHSTGTVACLGAAAGVAKVLGLTTEQVAWALGLAGSMAGGIFEFLRDGSFSKLLHAGHAAFSGVTTALLASEGFTGPSTVLEGEEGFCRAFSDKFNLEMLTKELGSQYEMDYVYFKRHAACGHSFSAVDSALEIRRQLDGMFDRIRHINIKTYRAAAVLAKKEPDSVRDAKFSIPYAVALALVKGSAGHFHFCEENLHDEKILNLAAKIDVWEDKEITANFPEKRTAVVEAKLENGKVLTVKVDIPRGMPENPLSEEELIEKFKALAGMRLDPVKTKNIIDVVLITHNESFNTVLAEI